MGMIFWEENFESYPSLTDLVSQLDYLGFFRFGFGDCRREGGNGIGVKLGAFGTVENSMILVPAIHAETELPPFVLLSLGQGSSDLGGIYIDWNGFGVGPFVVGVGRSRVRGGRRFWRSRGWRIGGSSEIGWRFVGWGLGFLFELALVHSIVDVDGPFFEGVESSKRLRELRVQIFDSIRQTLAKLRE
jgi:hypothetical protein